MTYNYETIKNCVSGVGWQSSVITPSSLEVFEGVDYYEAWEVLRRLESDGVIECVGLHKFRRTQGKSGSESK